MIKKDGENWSVGDQVNNDKLLKERKKKLNDLASEICRMLPISEVDARTFVYLTDNGVSVIQERARENEFIAAPGEISQGVKALLTKKDFRYIPKIEKYIRKIESRKFFNNSEINEYLYKIMSMGFNLKSVIVFLKYLLNGWMADQEILTIMVCNPEPLKIDKYFNLPKITKWQKILKWIRRENG